MNQFFDSAQSNCRSPKSKEECITIGQLEYSASQCTMNNCDSLSSDCIKQCSKLGYGYANNRCKISPTEQDCQSVGLVQDISSSENKCKSSDSLTESDCNNIGSYLLTTNLCKIILNEVDCTVDNNAKLYSTLKNDLASDVNAKYIYLSEEQQCKINVQESDCLGIDYGIKKGSTYTICYENITSKDNCSSNENNTYYLEKSKIANFLFEYRQQNQCVSDCSNFGLFPDQNNECIFNNTLIGEQESTQYKIVLINTDENLQSQDDNRLYFKINCADLGLISITKQEEVKDSEGNKQDTDLEFCEFPDESNKCKSEDGSSEKIYWYNKDTEYSRCIISSDCEATLDKVPVLNNDQTYGECVLPTEGNHCQTLCDSANESSGSDSDCNLYLYQYDGVNFKCITQEKCLEKNYYYDKVERTCRKPKASLNEGVQECSGISRLYDNKDYLCVEEYNCVLNGKYYDSDQKICVRNGQCLNDLYSAKDLKRCVKSCSTSFYQFASDSLMECVNADECSPLTANSGENKCTNGCNTANFGKKINENFTECAFCANQNCISCSDNYLICTECDKGYHLKVTFKDKENEDDEDEIESTQCDSCSVQGCLSCPEQGNCKECDQGYGQFNITDDLPNVSECQLCQMSFCQSCSLAELDQCSECKSENGTIVTIKDDDNKITECITIQEYNCRTLRNQTSSDLGKLQSEIVTLEDLKNFTNFLSENLKKTVQITTIKNDGNETIWRDLAISKLKEFINTDNTNEILSILEVIKNSAVFQLSLTDENVETIFEILLDEKLVLLYDHFNTTFDIFENLLDNRDTINSLRKTAAEEQLAEDIANNKTTNETATYESFEVNKQIEQVFKKITEAFFISSENSYYTKNFHFEFKNVKISPYDYFEQEPPAASESENEEEENKEEEKEEEESSGRILEETESESNKTLEENEEENTYQETPTVQNSFDIFYEKDNISYSQEALTKLLETLPSNQTVLLNKIKINYNFRENNQTLFIVSKVYIYDFYKLADDNATLEKISITNLPNKILIQIPILIDSKTNITPAIGNSFYPMYFNEEQQLYAEDGLSYKESANSSLFIYSNHFSEFIVTENLEEVPPKETSFLEDFFAYLLIIILCVLLFGYLIILLLLERRNKKQQKIPEELKVLNNVLDDIKPLPLKDFDNEKNEKFDFSKKL